MRSTPIPLLRYLDAGRPVIRCHLCQELVFAREECKVAKEAMACPPRARLEGHPKPIPIR